MRVRSSLTRRDLRQQREIRRDDGREGAPEDRVDGREVEAGREWRAGAEGREEEREEGDHHHRGDLGAEDGVPRKIISPRKVDH